MRFGPVPLAEAEGAILAHSQRAGDRKLKKGQVLSAADIAALAAAGHETVVAARLEPDDIDENEAAARIAKAAAGDNISLSPAATGRCNLYAEARGLAVIDAARIDRVNGVDEALTVASIRPYEPVEAGQMVATVKVVTFALDRRVVETGAQIAGEGGALVRVAAYRHPKVGLIQTRLAGIKDSVLDKTSETTRLRVVEMGGRFAGEVRCAHTEAEVAAALAGLRDQGCQIVLVLGASAVVDRRDVLPAAIERAGGAIEHFGMPVDPGNLMLLARWGDLRVLGLPGSARSPRLHGSDWVLQRLMAGLPVTGRDLMGMGVGGLLKEIPGRPLPRAEAAPRRRHRAKAAAQPRIAAVVLAAGQSRRMGPVNKLLADIEGVPMVLRVVDAALASRARPVVVVVGHEAERVRQSLSGRDVTVVENPDYAGGLSTSLRRGISALGDEVDGALVLLGDMPRIGAGHLDRLIAAFDPAGEAAICVPVFGGKRGNPVLWGRRFFAELQDIAGDVGARHLIGEHADSVAEIEMGDEGVLIDVDSPAALTALVGAAGNEA